MGEGNNKPLRGALLEELTWPEAKSWFEQDATVIIPIGALSKEHGHHLPLNTDYLLAKALSGRVAEELPVVVAPVVGFGYYPAFCNYPGSQHLKAETFIALLRELITGFIHQGVGNIAIINTGVSTEGPVQIIVREILAEHGVRIAVANIRDLGRSTDHLFEQKLGGHADEHETSIIMAIKREAVRLENAQEDYGNQLEIPKSVYYQPSIFSSDPASGPDYSITGARGDPSMATIEKGKAALDAMVFDLVKGLELLGAGTLSKKL
ncbi:MAG: creatininase family protein [Rhizobiaceae bacterium]